MGVGVGVGRLNMLSRLKNIASMMRLIAFIAVIVLALSFAWKSYNLASALNTNLDEIKYVSDETWYVTASRNILVAMGYSLKSEVNGTLYATIFFSENETLRDYIANAGYYRVKIVYEYEKIRAVGVRGSPESVERSIRGYEVSKVVWGYPYPDRENIDSYYNLEHPPLGKYFIGVSMLFLGDIPKYWRVPGVVSGTIIILLAFLIGYKLSGILGGLLASIVLYFDTLLLNMASIAMLEIYVMLFLTLTLLFLVLRKPILASIALGLASSVKFSGIFATIPLYIIARREGYDPFRAYLLAFILPLTIIGLTCSPLYPIFGFSNVISSLVSSIGWHTSIKHELTKGPPVSAPWEWFYNANPFYFHFNPDLAAVVNPPIYVGALILSLILLGALASRKYLIQSYPSLLLAFTLLGYVGMYILGGRTQYSYYASLLTPMVAIVISQLVTMVGEPCLIVLSLSNIKRGIVNLVGLKWLPSRFGERDYQFLISSALTFWFLSFLLHLPDSNIGLGRPSFYSDYMAVYGEYISKNPTGVPYFSYYFNRPPLVGFIAFIGGFFGEFGKLIRGGVGEVASYYFFNSLISLGATLLIVDTLWELRLRLKIKALAYLAFMTPTFLMFSCYDWTILASAITLYAYSCIVKSDIKRGVFSLALASAINPYLIIIPIVMWSLKVIDGRNLRSFLLAVFLINSPLMLDYRYLLMAYERFLNWYSEGSLWVLIPESLKPPYFTFLTFLLGVLTSLILIFKYRRTTVDNSTSVLKLLWASLSLALVVSDVFRPQYALIIHTLYALIISDSLPLFYLFEILNVGIIVLWWSQKTWSHLLFNVTIPQGYSAYSIVGWMAILRNLILLGLVWRVLAGRQYERI